MHGRAGKSRCYHTIEFKAKSGKIVSIGRKSPHQPLRCRQAVAAGDHERDLTPVDPAVEAHANPALVADVGRHEETLRVGADEDRLAAGRCLAPQRRRAGIAAMHAEDLVAHAEGRLPLELVWEWEGGCAGRFWPFRQEPIEGRTGEYGRDRRRTGRPKAAGPAGCGPQGALARGSPPRRL